MGRKNALHALKDLCTFIGAIALFSYFYNWTVDLRHWYVTLASAFMCSILWLGFYVIEARGGVTRVVLAISRLLTKSESSSPTSELALPANPPASHAAVRADPRRPENFSAVARITETPNRGGESATTIYSLIGSTKLNGIDPES
jgi:hypothetical protein